MKIKFPKSLNRRVFYHNILPKVYDKIIKKEFDFIFDLSLTVFAEPEALISLLSASSTIKNRYNYIPKIIFPHNNNTLKYFENVNFFDIAKRPNNVVLDFIKFTTYINEKRVNKEFYISNIYNVTLDSDIGYHQTKVNKIVHKFLKVKLEDVENPEYWNFYKLLELSFLQLIQNFFEHNLYKNTYNTTSYYIAQKIETETENKIQIVFYDNGKGFRKRILEMIDEDNVKIKNGSEGKLEIEKYRKIENTLRNENLWFDKSRKNSNYVAIKTAMNYRNNSVIPGLSVIKDFVFSKGGTIFIHTANVLVECDNEMDTCEVLDYNFSGVHFCIEMPL